jgi:hypothetical protein
MVALLISEAWKASRMRGSKIFRCFTTASAIITYFNSGLSGKWSSGPRLE